MTPEWLEWFRKTTEAQWAEATPSTLDEYREAGVGGADWQRGTKWTGGLSEPEIAALEREVKFSFPPDYRLFLAMLHSTDRPRVGAHFEGEELVADQRPGFYDWRERAGMWEAHENVLEGLVFDVEHNDLWPDPWGPRPPTDEARRARVIQLVKAAPPLIPIFGHRFVVLDGECPVLSIHQSDIIIYGRDLPHYLMVELFEPGDEDPTVPPVEGIRFWGDMGRVAH